MLSQEAELALARLADGAVMNPIHTTARELIDAGLAMNDWGRLALTEEGRIRTRAWSGLPLRQYVIADLDYANLSAHVNPMGLGPERPAADIGFVPSAADFKAAHAEVESATVRPASYYDRAIAAAGTASGKTGEWPTSEWVHAFMDAFGELDETDE